MSAADQRRLPRPASGDSEKNRTHVIFRVMLAALRLTAPFLLSTVLLAQEATIPPDHLTKAETSSFRATSSYSETLAFAGRLKKTSPFVDVAFFGVSGEGRKMPLIVYSKDKAFTPEAAKKTGKPIVLILNGIHAGEIDGKEASLLYLRDLVFLRHRQVAENVILLIVPIYNVDGHERISKYNRPNQDGPVEGMGFRTNARGLDLNRDFLKTDAPETRALLRLLNDWQPDLFVDQHVTDGADFQATLTLAYGADRVTSPPLREWLDTVVPKALSAVEELGYKTAPYVNWRDGLDPVKGIEFDPPTPRFSTCYMPLRSIPAILVEMHSIKPFVERVRSNEAFLTSLLDEVADAPRALLEARKKAVASASAVSKGNPFPLVFETDFSRPREIDFAAFEWRHETSPVSGRPVIRYDRTKPKTVKMPVYERMKTKLETVLPAGYVVLPGWPGAARRLEAHGIAFSVTREPVEMDVEVFRASDAKFAEASYQGRVSVDARITRVKETRRIPAGAIYVPVGQPLTAVAVHLLEPEGPDSLFSWGEFSSALESKEYIDTRVLDPLALEMLKNDPALAAEWKKKLEDPAFSRDVRKRIRFFYSRTPYWDETQGLLPVFRVEKPLTPGLLETPSVEDAAPE